MPLISKERWWTLSLADHLGNIGSEVGRASKWQGKDEKNFGALLAELWNYWILQEWIRDG